MNKEYKQYVSLNYTEMLAASFNWNMTEAEDDIINASEAVVAQINAKEKEAKKREKKRKSKAKHKKSKTHGKKQKGSNKRHEKKKSRRTRGVNAWVSKNLGVLILCASLLMVVAFLSMTRTKA